MWNASRASERAHRPLAWRFRLLVAAVLAGLFAVPTPAAAQESEGASREIQMLLPDPEDMQRVEASVDAALKYLAVHQRPDGSWPSKYGNNHGVNALCLLAFLGRGHVPGRGPYQPVVDRSIAHLLEHQTEQGLFKSPNPSHGPMYEHALATLSLIEAYGFLPTPEMRERVQRAIDLIVKTQNNEGGWRYHPVPQQADLSATVMQIVALHAARNARLDVPVETMDKALKYVRACRQDGGGFRYQPQRNGARPGVSAAGILSMALLGDFDDPHIAATVDWIEQRAGYKPNMSHFWYFNYYAMQAHFQIGGSAWARWHPRVRGYLLDNQRPDGSWESGRRDINGPANCYSTAMAAISLEVFLHYLPAYQR